MRARKYNKKVEFYRTTAISDGYGGYYNGTISLGTAWAHITTLDRANRKTDEGITNAYQSLVVTIRNQTTLVLDLDRDYMLYRGKNYIIQQQPINKGFEDRELEFLVIESEE